VWQKRKCTKADGDREYERNGGQKEDCKAWLAVLILQPDLLKTEKKKETAWRRL